MAFSTTTSAFTVSGTGDMTPIPISFLFYVNAHITAILNTSGVETTWVEGTHYNLTGAGTGSGTLTPLVTFPLGSTLTIKREAPFTQEAVLPTAGPLPAKTIEQMVDLSIMNAQDLAETISRAFVVGVTDTVNGEIPNKTTRANKFMAFDSNGDPIASSAAVGGAPVSSFMEPVLAATTAAAVRGLLEAAPQHGYLPTGQAAPDMTVLVASGSFFRLDTGARVVNAAQTTATITAPTTNPRIDLVYVDRRSGVVGVATGTEAATPVAPAVPAGKLPVAEVALATSTTQITDSLITDVRELWQLGWRSGVTAGDLLAADATGYPAADGSQITNLGIPRGYIDGLTLSNNGTDVNNDIDIAAGLARDGGDAANMALSATLVKQLDATWAVGTNQGGLDTGTKTANTWYHVWLIRRSDSGVVDALFSTSATAPTMPTSYNQKRRIGAIRTDGASNIIGFSQVGAEFLWNTPVSDYSAVDPTTDGVLRALRVPTGVQVRAIHAFSHRNVTMGTGLDERGLVTSPDQADVVPSSTLFSTVLPNTGTAVDTYSTVSVIVRTNTSAQIRTRVSASDADVSVVGMTHGWIDPRGRDA